MNLQILDAVPRMRDDRQIGGLQALCRWAVERGAIAKAVEVGVYAGEATAVFACFFRDVLAVDPWQNGYDDADLASFMAPMEAVFAAFLERKNASGGVIRHLRNTSSDAAGFVADASLDFIYIDADHRYEAVLSDLATWMPKLRPGAILAGHDLSFPGVRRALSETIVDFNPVEFEGDSWAIQMP